MEWSNSVCIGWTRIFRSSFEDGPLWLVWSFWSVGLKCPFSISQNCCPQNHSFVSCLQEQWANMQWLGSGLCNWNVHNCTVPLGTWNLRNFKLEFLSIGKRPPSYCAISYLNVRKRATSRDKYKFSIRRPVTTLCRSQKIISLQSIKFICGLRNETSYNMLLVRTLTNKDCKGPQTNYAKE